MTRPSRVLVEKISAPQAEISTAGVIIAVRIARAFCGESSRANQSIAGSVLCGVCRRSLPVTSAVLKCSALEDVPDPAAFRSRTGAGARARYRRQSV